MVDSVYAEYARVRLLYEQLGIGERTRISYFPEYLPSAPYPTNDRETFEFLHEHLKWRRQP